MKQINKVSLTIGVVLIIVASLLMLDGKILGEITTNFSRVLLITAISIIATSRKNRTEMTNHSVQV